MKHIFIILIMTVAMFCCNAQAIKVSTYNAAFSKNSEGGLQHELGKPASSIGQKEFGGAVVYFNIDVKDYKAIKAKYRLEIVVYQKKDSQESYNYGMEMGIPMKNGSGAIYSEFIEGDYVVKVRDKENPGDVYSEANFTVTGKSKIDYKNNSTMVVCKSVDDNWMAVGQTMKIKTGECVNFLYKAKDRMNYGFLIWSIVKVSADGKQEYVNDLQQSLGDKPYRYVATTEGVCSFTSPGKYRIYLYEKTSLDTSHSPDGDFLGKTDITVE